MCSNIFFLIKSLNRFIICHFNAFLFRLSLQIFIQSVSHEHDGRLRSFKIIFQPTSSFIILEKLSKTILAFPKCEI